MNTGLKSLDTVHAMSNEDLAQLPDITIGGALVAAGLFAVEGLAVRYDEAGNHTAAAVLVDVIIAMAECIERAVERQREATSGAE